MVSIPDLLAPTDSEVVRFPSGHTILLPKATPRFEEWRGTSPADTYGGKAVLDFSGKPAFAELVILWTLEAAGWQGAWIDTYRRRFRSGYWEDAPDVQLPEAPAALLERIYATAGTRSGAFDVIAWSQSDVLFAESKRSGHDQLRDSQYRWIESALAVGVPPDRLLIIEWST